MINFQNQNRDFQFSIMEKAMKSFSEFIQKSKLESKPHQTEGVQWILSRELQEKPIENVRGGLVADEMGLGKTIMMIGTIVSNFKKNTLIVLPLALVSQWEMEIFKTTGHHPLIFHGSNKKTIDLETLKKAPIVLTTYGILNERYDKKKGVTIQSVLTQIEWSRIIFDEAHHMVNPKSLIYNSVKKMKGDIKWLLTGTPIQNKKTDFYSLCDIMGFKSDYYTNEKNLMELVRTSIMKRTKADVGLKLPEKSDETQEVEWEDKERKMAKKIHSSFDFANITETKNGLSFRNRGIFGEYPIVQLLRARQVCIYPKMLTSLIQKNADTEDKEIRTLKKTSEKYSSKLNMVCEKIIERKNNGNSKIVFCHFRQEIDRISQVLSSNGFRVAIIDGRIKKSQRQTILSDLYDVLILQIKTGSEGLNLQQYNEVYFVSPHWNPSTEDQAVGRCYRIGQTKPVHVFRFEMEPFGEESMNLDNYAIEKQEEKREMYEIINANANSP